MSRFAVQLKGFRELSDALGELTPRMADAAARKAVRAAAKPVITQARANLAALPLQDSTGLLRRSIGVKVRKYRNRRSVSARSRSEAKILASGGVTLAVIGPRKGYGQVVQRRIGKYNYRSKASFYAPLIFANAGTTRGVYSDPVKYAHLLEGGVRPHAVGKGSSLRKGIQRKGQHPGFRAKPWLEPALYTMRNKAQSEMVRVFQEALRQEAARARAKVNGAARRAA